MSIESISRTACRVLGFLWVVILSLSMSAAEVRPPNIVLIFTDDLGYGDVEGFGNPKHRTPNLRKLAQQGRSFKSFYVAQPVCSASRAALLTGCYPNRIGIQGALGPAAKIGLHSNEVTIAELAKARGYATAVYGKWHLGHHPPFLPTRHGFDEFFGLPYSNDMWPFHPEAPKGTYPDLPLIQEERVLELNPDQSRITTELTHRAVDFIERSQNRSFFLYIAHPMPHVPLFVSEERTGNSGTGLYGDVIEEIDWSVGQVLNALQRFNLEDKTLVIFTSDNGPWLSYGAHAGSSGGLREGKGTAWEGGVRVPCIMAWPGKIPAGTETTEPMMTIDLFPTLAHLLESPLPNHKIDGKNAWPLISGEPGASSPQGAYYFWYNNNELQAVRSGKWKLYAPHAYRSLNGRPGGVNGIPAKYEQLRTDWALFDLEQDPAEKNNLAHEQVKVVEELQRMMENARADLGDTLSKRVAKNARAPGRI